MSLSERIGLGEFRKYPYESHPTATEDRDSHYLSVFVSFCLQAAAVGVKTHRRLCRKLSGAAAHDPGTQQSLPSRSWSSQLAEWGLLLVPNPVVRASSAIAEVATGGMRESPL